MDYELDNGKKPIALKWQVAIIVVPLLVAIVVIGAHVTNSVATWFKYNTLKIQSPLVVTAQKVIVVEKVKKETPIVQFVYDGEVDTIDTPIEEKVYKVFGKDYPTAIAVCKAESGCTCSRVNINDNKTADLGPFQINTVHLNRWTLQELADCDKNIEIAKTLVDEQGWDIWVAYTNGSWLAHLD